MWYNAFWIFISSFFNVNMNSILNHLWFFNEEFLKNIKFYFRPSREIISNKESKFRRIEVMKVILLISYIFFFFFFVFFSQNKFYFEKFQHTLFFFKIFHWRIFVKKHEISFQTIMLLFLFSDFQFFTIFFFNNLWGKQYRRFLP